jgi:hypothetical protein
VKVVGLDERHQRRELLEPLFLCLMESGYNMSTAARAFGIRRQVLCNHRYGWQAMSEHTYLAFCDFVQKAAPAQYDQMHALGPQVYRAMVRRARRANVLQFKRVSA